MRHSKKKGKKMKEVTREDMFFREIKAFCREPGKAYGFDCPICGNYAIGLLSLSGNLIVGSCANCKIAGKRNLIDLDK